ncbi:hypothetical protein [Streptomyces sp. NPDC001744]|uniref:hypothetical protein n=1 Tax=Streptomyces sp. NPDC001744 TaxID=3364606 RepID=UPI0036AF03E2
MPSYPRPRGRPRPAARVNAAIRRLMEEPHGERRAREYRRLLVEWGKATRCDLVKAA